MNEFPVDRIMSTFILFVLVLLRCGGLVIFSPFFGSELIPARFRTLFAVGFSILLLGPAAATARVPERMEVSDLCILAAQEVAIGLVIGFLASFVILGAQLAGELASHQMGFSMANIVDPMTGQDLPLFGFIQMNLALMLFLTAKLHLALMYVVFQTYEYIGIGALVFEGAVRPVLERTVGEMDRMFDVGLKLALPVMMVMLLNSVVEGFVTRTMPQMNIMVLGIPLRVTLGLTALFFVLPAACRFLVPQGTLALDLPASGPFRDMFFDLADTVKEVGRTSGGDG